MFRKSTLLTILTVALMLMVAVLMRDPISVLAAEDVNLSTPERIEAAFQRGDITSAERILYLTYAIYEHESLPAVFDGTKGWHGTMTVREIHKTLAESRSSFPADVLMEIDRVMNSRAATICDREDGPNNTTTTNFYYNYDTIDGGLTIGDYTASMEAAYTKLVTEYNWAKPPLCTQDAVDAGGCSNANNLGGSGLYPVQIAAIGGSLFGYVTPNLGDGLYSGVVEDNPNTAAVETDSRASCMVLNSDFSQFSGNTAQENLDATTSHEYVHSVQFGYGDPQNNDAMWFESTAAYFEDEMSDAANTANLYLWPTTTNCMGEWPNDAAPDGVSQYSAFLFFRHVAENAGGANAANTGENVIQQLWENIGQDQIGLVAMDNALNAASPSTNMNDAYHNYAIAVRKSKSCTGGHTAPYCFTEGDEYLASNDTPPPAQGSIAASPGSYSGSVNEHYATNYVDLPTTGTFLVSLQNTATDGVGQLRGSLVCDTGSALNVYPLSQIAANGQSATLNINGGNCPSGLFLTITNQGTTAGTEPAAGSCPASRAATNYTVTLGTATAVDMQEIGTQSGNNNAILLAFVIAATLGSVAIVRKRNG